MPAIAFDRFYRYDDLIGLLRAYAEENPNLVRLEIIGRSHEGRAIPLLVFTNTETGPDAEKPALWVDGNIHASELATSTACLYFIEHLVSNYGRDETVTRALDEGAIYVCPRINPDGAEWALADSPKIIRSSTRPYPYDEDPVEGLVREDVDGDGRLLQMRILDPHGPWKIADEDPRLLVRRDPTESGGQYYRVLPEGRLIDYDGVHIKVQRPKEGLDLNRNFPDQWRQEHEQIGAGPYPVSEPEVRAVVDFVAHHPNIVSTVTFHTMSGVLLRPYDSKSDDELPAEDLWTYQKQGAKGTDVTGYPNISVFHEFRYHPKQVIGGTFSWVYEHLGMYSWAVELWSPQRQAGITDYKYIDWWREHPVEDDLKLLQWNEEALEGKGYVDWYEFDHPQLGKVELGGWNGLYAITNPPPAFLEEEVAPFPEWLLWLQLTAPRLEVLEATASPLTEGEDSYRVRMVVANAGWLPSYGSKKALEKKAARPLHLEIVLPEGARLLSGKARQEKGQLEGRAYKPSAPIGWRSGDDTDERASAEWVVQVPAGSVLRLEARHDRAGVVRAEIEISS